MVLLDEPDLSRQRFSNWTATRESPHKDADWAAGLDCNDSAGQCIT